MKLNKMYQPSSVDKPILVSDISIQKLIDDGLLILFREIHNLQIMSVNGKLSASDARDLRDHLKLLFEIRDQEDGTLKGLSDIELKEKVKQVLDTEGIVSNE